MKERLHIVDHYVTCIAHHGAEHPRDRDEKLHVKLSPTLQDRLGREAAERGMRLHDWAVLKLAQDAESRIGHPSGVHPRRVPRWRTRC
jgi:predicted HicB family RNase H-like nuclease